MTKEKAPLHDRMARPFTQASHERANEIFDDGLYHMSDRRNLPRALAYFKQVLKIDPNHVGALSYLGILSQDFCQNYLEAEQAKSRQEALNVLGLIQQKQHIKSTRSKAIRAQYIDSNEVTG